MRKPPSYICESKGADQMRCNRKLSTPKRDKETLLGKSYQEVGLKYDIQQIRGTDPTDVMLSMLF